MYPFYYPSSSYGAPSYPSSTPSDAEYFRALAEERAAREQYAAARRAQEEARQRAARARAARRAYASPYSSFHDEDYNDYDLDMDVDDGSYLTPQRPLSYAGGQRPYSAYPSAPQFSSPAYSTSPQFSGPFGVISRQQRALLEEQRRRQLLEEQRQRELLELERERRRQEEERLRRILQEERQREEAERRKMLEEERLRRAMEEEKLRRAIEEEKLRRAMLEEEAARRERDRAQLRSQQTASLEPLLRAFGFVPMGSDSDSDKERPGRDARNTRATRARTTSPGLRHSPGAPRSPLRPTQSSQPSTAEPMRRTGVSPSPKASSPASTTIPITSPKSASKPAPTAEKQDTPKQQERAKPDLPPFDNPTPVQVAAAEKIQEAYRAHSARKQSLKSIATLRKRFLNAKSKFTLPTTLDYETTLPGESTVGRDGRPHTTVTVDPSVALPSPSLSAADTHDADPFAHVPKLAYTPTNAPIHAYEEELSRILSALDAVESRGDAGVRAARRELARMVEREAERVERWRGVVWNWWTAHGHGKRSEGPLSSEADAPSEDPSAPVEQPAGQDEPADSAPKEQEMPVEPPEQPTEQPMETEPAPATEESQSAPTVEKTAPTPTTEETIPTVAPMEVEPSPAPQTLSPSDAPISIPISSPASTPAPEQPAPQAEQPAPEPTPVAEAPATPEIDIPDADVNESAPPVEIEVEVVPPSRAEPADDDALPEGSLSLPSPITEEPDRASTPPLSEADADAEMDVAEPEEARTPPPGAHAPLVVVGAEGEHVVQLPEPGKQQQQQAQDQDQASQQQQPVTKTASLVDRSWDEFRTYDMF